MIGLGLDAGGTATRWALADGVQVLAQGTVGTLSGLMLSEPVGQAQFEAELRRVVSQLPRACVPQSVVFGLTGLGSGSRIDLAETITAKALALRASQIHLRSDMALVHQVHFAPGKGHVLYAGTGSYASFWDDQGLLHRVGGRGAILDDAGGGFWIGCEALRAVWRAEEGGLGVPRSPLALAVFEQIGSDEWSASRALLYGQSLALSRGKVAQLTRAVANTQSVDALAQDILVRAGHELARLGLASLRRQPNAGLVLAGKVLTQLETVQASCQERLRVAQASARPAEVSHLDLALAAAQLAASGDISIIEEA